jgi:molybdate transport system substrate-binding protein
VHRRSWWVAVALCAALVGCGDDGPDQAGPRGDAEGDALSGSLTVFAAASLTDAFGELGAAFEMENDHVSVAFNFASSSSLREQILSGAPADVFASANLSNMDQVIEAGDAAASETFAVNRLQIVVPAGNPAGITGLSDFGRDELLLGLCAEQVPCGQLAREVLGRAGVEPSVDTNEPDVRSLLTKVEEGELDAGVVYATDVHSGGGRVEGVDIPDDQNVLAAYPIAVVAGSANPAAARAFVDFVRSEQGQQILATYGFTRP